MADDDSGHYFAGLGNSPDHDDALELAVFQTLRQNWRWVLSSVLICFVGFAAAAFLITPVYRASTVLVPAAPERSALSNSIGSALGAVGGLASLAGVGIGAGNPETEEAIAVLKSRAFTEKFIVDFNLLPELFRDRWDATTGTWKDKEPSMALAYRRFNRDIRAVWQDKRTGLVTLSIEWRDPEKAAAWANELVSRLNAEMRTRAINTTQASVRYLSEEMASTSLVEIRESITRLMETQINQRMVASVTAEYAFRVVDRALPPDLTEIAKPQRALWLVAGPLIGLVLGIAIALTIGRHTA